jgi:hypothetical protein
MNVFSEEMSSSNMNTTGDASFSLANNITLNSTTSSAPPSSSLLPPSTDGTSDASKTILLSMGWVILLLLCACSRRKIPSREHWRGREIRERHQRDLQRRQELLEKQQQSPEDRQALVSSSMRTKRILAQDEEGNMTLGNLSLDDKASPQKTNPFPAAPDYDDDDEEEDDEDEDEYACVICLEPFQVGDVVSWSRFSETCHHVFHTDCIQSWLEDKRQDDCPSCRTTLIVNHKQGESHATTTTQKDEENQLDDNDEDADADEDDPEEDSFFVIIHGLISRAARRASYALVNTNNALDAHHLSDASSSTTMIDLSVPSPLRRVVSQGPHQPRRKTSLVNSFHNLLSYHPAHFEASSKSSPLSTPISLQRSQSDISTPTRSSNNSLPTTIRRRWPRNAASQEDHREPSVHEANLDWLIHSDHASTTTSTTTATTATTTTTSTATDRRHASLITTLADIGEVEAGQRELFPSQSTSSE